MNSFSAVKKWGILVDKTAKKVENLVGKAVKRGGGIVDKMFGFGVRFVRVSTFGRSVEKFCRWISTFGFVRFVPCFGAKEGQFLHIFHIAYYYY